MITMTTEGVQDLLQGLSGMERQIPYAVANGLNVTGRRAKFTLSYSMRSVFDRPTPFTLNSLQMTPAIAPKTAEVQIWFKDPPNLGLHGHYLLPQVEGGPRPMKPFEMGMGFGRFIIPSKFAQLDQYGNLGRGQITKLMSAAGGFNEIGFTMNARGKSKQYFVLRKGNWKLPAGIYQRVVGDEAAGRVGRYLIARALVKKGKQKGQLKALKDHTKAMVPRGKQSVVLFQKSAPKYNKRFDFYGISEDVVNRNLEQDLTRAIEAEIERELAYRSRKGLS
jgi:hypothetical protein